MKAHSRSPWLTALALLSVLASPIAGARTAHAGDRDCTLEGAWVNAAKGTTNRFDVTGTLVTPKDGSSIFFGIYLDGQTEADVNGTKSDGIWVFNFEYRSGGSNTGMVKLATGTQQATESKKEFSVTGTYETYVNREKLDRYGEFTLSGTCVKG